MSDERGQGESSTITQAPDTDIKKHPFTISAEPSTAPALASFLKPEEQQTVQPRADTIIQAPFPQGEKQTSTAETPEEANIRRKGVQEELKKKLGEQPAAELIAKKRGEIHAAANGAITLGEAHVRALDSIGNELQEKSAREARLSVSETAEAKARASVIETLAKHLQQEEGLDAKTAFARVQEMITEQARHRASIGGQREPTMEEIATARIEILDNYLRTWEKQARKREERKG